MADRSRLKPETRAAQALHLIDPASGGLVPAIQPSTTFARGEDYELVAAPYSYSRDGNPSYEAAERLLADLEGGAAARIFASGKAVTAAVVQALVPGDHIVAPRVMYWGIRNWLVQFSATWGLELELYDAEDPAALEQAVKPGRTKLVWIETPANPTWTVIDIAAAAALAHDVGARLAVDSTVATPVLTRPIELGADLVMHSATKYLNGHGDVVAGALIAAREDDFWDKACRNRSDLGAVLGPFEAWLLQRGLRTLYLRVRQASDSALTIARHFQGHGAISAVLYPGLESHPGHDVAAAQMTGGFGGMMSLRVAGGAEAALRVAMSCRVFQRATSLGGVESLVEHRATIEGPSSPVPADLLRLSIGIEDPGDLIADLEQALAGKT